MKTRKRPDTPAQGAARARTPPHTGPTIVLVGFDPLSFEQIRASFAGGPFFLRRAAEPPPENEADLAVMPARDFTRTAAASGPPVIAHGPAALMRASFLAGCADYLREPWDARELVLRAEAVLSHRRRYSAFPWGNLDWEGDALCTPGGPVSLTRQQAVILKALLGRRGTPVARAALSALLGERPGSRTIDVQVSAIRRRVRAAVPAAGRLIVSVRGQGYLIP